MRHGARAVVRDALDVADPSNLGLRTFVNGKQTQSGQYPGLDLRHPVLDRVPELVHDVGPGDVILTGTPEGVQNVMPGDDIVCEIDGLGRLKTPLPRTRRSAGEGIKNVRIEHLIGGAATPGAEYFETVNPATQMCSPRSRAEASAKVDAAVAAAKTAFPKWAAAPAAERARALAQARRFDCRATSRNSPRPKLKTPGNDLPDGQAARAAGGG